VSKGDRVAYIAPNVHAQLESFYAVPQIGAVLVPINYRLIADDFRYLIAHSGAKVVCAHGDYLDAVDSIRGDLPGVQHYVALTGARDGWLDYDALVRDSEATFAAPAIDERDLLTINYTSGTTARPKGVMITHRNAWMNSIGVLVHLPMSVADRYLWTLPMFHANGWTFTWTVTAAGGTHICLAKVDPTVVFDLIARERVTMLCAAPTGPDWPGQRARGDPCQRAPRRPRHRGRRAARGGDDRTDGGGTGLDGDAGLRPDRDRALHHHLRVPARSPRPAESRALHDQGATGRGADHVGRAARDRRSGPRGGGGRRRDRRDRRARQRRDGRLLQRSRGDRARDGRRLVPHR
jgi:hypothetical protein